MKLTKYFLLKFLLKEWLLCCPYNPIKDTTLSHSHLVSKALDDPSKKYENVILLADFNKESDEKTFNFQNPYHLKNIVK